MHSVVHVSYWGVIAKNRRRTLSMMICLAVLSAALAIVVVSRYDNSRVPLVAREVSVITQMACFKTALEEFKIDNGFYPTGSNGLMALVHRPAGVTNWHGPYIHGLPKDPWDQDYRYECPGKHTAAGYPYDLWSLGGPPVNSTIANYDWGLKP